MISQGTLFLGSEHLSEHMAESMDSGLFWFCLAARSSWGFLPLTGGSLMRSILDVSQALMNA